jgi:hypothetical protein
LLRGAEAAPKNVVERIKTSAPPVKALKHPRTEMLGKLFESGEFLAVDNEALYSSQPGRIPLTPS